jgi:hypothetical protein
MSAHIVTVSKAVDDMLDGGIVVGEITELCGAPGSGKTQIRCIVHFIYPYSFVHYHFLIQLLPCFHCLKRRCRFSMS